jgi:hypothetical protein
MFLALTDAVGERARMLLNGGPKGETMNDHAKPPDAVARRPLAHHTTARYLIRSEGCPSRRPHG